MSVSAAICPRVALDAALGGEPCQVVGPDERFAALATKRWLGPPDLIDRGLLLSRCRGPTLDVGCGPGRMTAGLLQQGTLALGIDISAVAVRHSLGRGATALRRDVFGAVPAAGRWHHVLLADGNVGIGGDPVRLLRRSRELLCDGGTIVVELSAPGIGVRRDRIRLRVFGRISAPFRWAFVGADAIDSLASSAELEVVETGAMGGRWAAVLRNPLTRRRNS